MRTRGKNPSREGIVVIDVRDDGSTLRLPLLLDAIDMHDGCVLLASRCTPVYRDNREGRVVSQS